MRRGLSFAGFHRKMEPLGLGQSVLAEVAFRNRSDEMDVIRRVVGVVSGFGVALAVTGSASAQYDMLPYQPYTGQYRSSGFPADQGNGGYFNLPPTPAPRFSGGSFADRVDADLDGGTTEVQTKAERKVEQDRTLRDRYYREAQQAKNPAERARLMRMYRDEDRRLSRGLAARPNGSATRTATGEEASSRSDAGRRRPSALAAPARGGANAAAGGTRATAPSTGRTSRAATPAGRSGQPSDTAGASGTTSTPAPR